MEERELLIREADKVTCAEEASTEPDLTFSEIVIEEVAIDGICGVY